METILFQEKQRFNQWWIHFIFSLINGFFMYGFYVQIIQDKIFGGKPMSDAGIIIATCISIMLTFLFYLVRLESQIKDDGIYVRFFPLQWKFKFFAWENLSKTYVRSYNPLIEYGGWGLRYNILGNGIAYNVSGNMGLQLEIQSKNKLLIGTNKPEELRAVLEKLEKIKLDG